jgi:hypothetical protein
MHTQALTRQAPSGTAHVKSRHKLLTAAGALVAFLALELVFSSSAAAFNPIHIVEEGAEAVGGIAGGVVSSGAVGAFKGIIKFLFGGIEAYLTLAVLSLLVHVSVNTGGAVSSLYNLTSGIAIAALGGIMTLSVFRYWIVGLTGGDDAFSAIKGVTRSIGTVCFILMWPWIFLQLQGSVNVIDSAILRSPAIEGDIGTLFRVTGVGNPFAFASGVGIIINIFVAILFVILLLGLFSMKIVLTYSVGVIYVAMPLGIAVWPIEELAWIPKLLARSLGLCLLIPMVWTLVFSTWGAIGDNAVNLRGTPGQVLIQPLIVISMLWMAVSLPHSLLRMARQGLGGLGGGSGRGQVASMTASRMVSRQAEGLIASKGLMPFGPEGHITEQRRATQRRSERIEGRLEANAERESRRRSRDNSGGNNSEFTSSPNSTSTKKAPDAKKVASAATTGAATGGTGAAAEAAAAKGGKSAAAQAKNGQVAGKQGATPSQAKNPAQQSGKPGKATPPDRQPATTPSVSPSRPTNPNKNMADVLPSKKDVPRDVNRAAREQALGMKTSMHDATESWGKLGPSMQNRIRASATESASIEHLGNTVARWSTSDQISNAQSSDLLKVASVCYEAGADGKNGLGGKIRLQASGPGSAAARRGPAASPPPGKPVTPNNNANGSGGSGATPPPPSPQPPK